jgi:hypothetical protein
MFQYKRLNLIYKEIFLFIYHSVTSDPALYALHVTVSETYSCFSSHYNTVLSTNMILAAYLHDSTRLKSYD